MNEMNNSPSCERACDLMAFLYDEETEQEKRDFELHLKACSVCREEVVSFGLLRESITDYRDEALSGFESTPLPSAAGRKSASAALRQFFDLSPLWLKGATGFAVIAFCVLAVLAFVRLQSNNQPVITSAGPEAIYTEDDVERLVNAALAKQSSGNPRQIPEIVINDSPKPKTMTTSRRRVKSRRPLSRAEREQLAADLRLLSTDDAGLHLLSDRINQ